MYYYISILSISFAFVSIGSLEVLVTYSIINDRQRNSVLEQNFVSRNVSAMTDNSMTAFLGNIGSTIVVKIFLQLFIKDYNIISQLNMRNIVIYRNVISR